MQKLILLVALILTLLSCSKEEDQVVNESCLGEINLESQQFPQVWRLIKMTGSMINSETTGENMSWQEYIRINADGTFTKHREQNNKTIEVSGTYSFELIDPDQSTELTLFYESESELIGNCYNQLMEKYILPSKCKLQGTWSYCDGPGLEYERQP